MFDLFASAALSSVAEPEPVAFSFNSSPLTSLSSLPDVDESPPPASSATQVQANYLNDADDTRSIAEVGSTSTFLSLHDADVVYTAIV